MLSMDGSAHHQCVVIKHKRIAGGDKLVVEVTDTKTKEAQSAMQVVHQPPPERRQQQQASTMEVMSTPLTSSLKASVHSILRLGNL